MSFSLRDSVLNPTTSAVGNPPGSASPFPPLLTRKAIGNGTVTETISDVRNHGASWSWRVVQQPAQEVQVNHIHTIIAFLQGHIARRTQWSTVLTFPPLDWSSLASRVVCIPDAAHSQETRIDLLMQCNCSRQDVSHHTVHV